jgi:hypothetical protein
MIDLLDDATAQKYLANPKLFEQEILAIKDVKNRACFQSRICQVIVT